MKYYIILLYSNRKSQVTEATKEDFDEIYKKKGPIKIGDHEVQISSIARIKITSEVRALIIHL